MHHDEVDDTERQCRVSLEFAKFKTILTELVFRGACVRIKELSPCGRIFSGKKKKKLAQELNGRAAYDNSSYPLFSHCRLLFFAKRDKRSLKSTSRRIVYAVLAELYRTVSEQTIKGNVVSTHP